MLSHFGTIPTCDGQLGGRRAISRYLQHVHTLHCKNCAMIATSSLMTDKNKVKLGKKIVFTRATLC